jgi:cysteine desulfurase/selenocysteine lyase
MRRFGIARIRQDFPLLNTNRDGPPLAYLDNAATTQKPQVVLDAMDRFYTSENANVHRGLYALSIAATDAYESARARLARFLGAQSPGEIIFTRGTTESINLVAQSWARPLLKAGDEILVSEMDHHSNIVPWQMVCHATGARLRVIPITDEGELRLDAVGQLLNARTRLLAVTHVSNVLGTVNPVRELTAMAHAAGALVLLDGAQAAAHQRIDVGEIGCDFYACSGHKMYGPTGIGVLFGRGVLLEQMPPWQGGGEMVLSVSFDRVVYDEPPLRFEAGTPNIAGAIGLAAAADYIESIGFENIAPYEKQLTDHGRGLLESIPGVRIIGAPRNAAPILSFVMDGIHPHDIGQILDEAGVAIRTGHHCCQPLMERFGISGTARISPAFYNTTGELDALAAAVSRLREVFG